MAKHWRLAGRVARWRAAGLNADSEGSGTTAPPAGLNPANCSGPSLSQTVSNSDVRANQALEKALGGGILFESLPIGVYCCDCDGVIWRFNRRAAELWGRLPEIGDRNHRFNGALRLFLPEGQALPHDAAPMAEALRSGRPVRDRRLVIERPDGSRIAVLVNIDPLLEEDGTLVGAVSCFQDISELARAEESLRDGEQRFRDVLEALPVAIYTTDTAGR